MAVETSAGNTEEDINFEVKEGECVPNLRGASPVDRGEGSVVRAGRERSAEASRGMSGNAGDVPRRGNRTGGSTTANDGARSVRL